MSEQEALKGIEGWVNENVPKPGELRPSFKVRLFQLDSHAHFSLWSNETGPGFTHGRAAEHVTLRRAEFKAFVERLDATVSLAPWPGCERDELLPELEGNVRDLLGEGWERVQ